MSQTPAAMHELARAVAAVEEACMREILDVLDRHQCEVITAPEPVDGQGAVWRVRWGVRFTPREERPA